MSRECEEVKVHFNFESDLKRDTIDDFFHNQEKLIDYTKRIDDCSNLCDINQLRSKYKFSSINSSNIPPKYPWVNKGSDLNKFLAETQLVSSADTQNMNGKELGSFLLKIQNLKQLLSSSHQHKDREQKIAITGRGSMGKSTILKLLLGHDVTYSAAGESTKLITEYYVHYIDDNLQCRFYFNATNDADSSKEIHDETALGIKIEDENASQKAITTTSAPLQIAIYTNKALVYGLLIDFPGLRGNTPGGSAVNNDDAIIDRMEKLLSESSNDSTIIVTETISKTSGGYVTSIEYLAEKMKSKNILKPFLEKCTIVINQTNNCFNQTNDDWILTTEEDAFHENNRILLQHISVNCNDAGVPLIKPIFLSIDMDLNKNIKPWNVNYDRKMKALLEPKLHALMYIDKIVCDGMEYVINDIVGKQKNAILSSRLDFQSLLKSLINGYKKNIISNEEFPHIMDGLLQAEEQLFRFITYFMTGRDGIDAHTALCKVCIDRDNEPKLHVYLKDIFKKGGTLTLCRSEYNLCGELVTDLTLEDLMKKSLEKVNKNKSFFKDPLKRNGADEIIETAKGIFSFMLNLKLSKFDEVRFESQQTRTGDSTCVRSSIKSGIDEIVNDDIRVIIGGIMKYLSDTLNWIYPQIIDASLLQSMNVSRKDSPNALNVAESMLELRYRCTQALQCWISQVLVLLNNNIEKGCTSSPEEIKSVSRLYSKLLNKIYQSPNVAQGFFDSLSQQNGITPNVLQTGLGVALNLLYDAGPLKTLSPADRQLINQSLINCFKNQFSSYKTSNNADIDSVNEQIMNAFFAIPEPIDHRLLKETERYEYASELFAVQIASILGEINNVFKREFVPFSSIQTSQRVAFIKIFHSYVYHDVGVPYLTNVVDTEFTSAKKVTVASSSNPFTIQAKSRDDHEARLAEIYKWNLNNPAQTVVDNSEKTLYDALSFLVSRDDKVKSFMA